MVYQIQFRDIEHPDNIFIFGGDFTDIRTATDKYIMLKSKVSDLIEVRLVTIERV